MKYQQKHKNFKYILQKYKYNLNPGDIVAGNIRYKEPQGFLVEFGDELSGYLPNEEIQLNYHDNNEINNNLINLTREFFLVTYNKHDKQSILSIKRLEYIRAWKRIKQFYSENIIFHLKIKYINQGGIITHIEGLQGFIPNSHVYTVNNQINQKKNLIQCRLLMTNEQKNEIIFSNKSALLYLSQHKFRVRELIYGIIVSIQEYGIFIEIYGILGLLHISEIGSEYIKNIYSIFEVGNLIKLKVIHLNMKQGRLSLSKRNLK